MTQHQELPDDLATLADEISSLITFEPGFPCFHCDKPIGPLASIHEYIVEERVSGEIAMTVIACCSDACQAAVAEGVVMHLQHALAQIVIQKRVQDVANATLREAAFGKETNHLDA